MNADVRELCGVSAATANRILASFVAEGNLIKYHEGGHWAYRNHDKWSKKSTDGSILFCAAITHLCSAKENIIAFKLSTDFSSYGVLGAMPLTSGQFDGKLPCLQGQRTRCPLPVDRKMTPSFFTFNYLHSNLRHDLSCYFCLTVIYLSYQLSLIYIFVGSVT